MSPLFRRISSRLAPERGTALVLTLGVLVGMGATAATALAFTTQNEQGARLQKADQVALALAEAGLNNALATLFSASNPSMESALPPKAGPATQQYEGGESRWYGELVDEVWTLTGVGVVPNPTGAAAVVRTVSKRARLGSSARGSDNNAVWNYLYADQLSGCTTIGNSSEINIPFYVRGNLCLQNYATVTGYALQVGGTLTISSPNARVGSSDAPIPEVHIGKGCSATPGVVGHSCTTADKVWGAKVDMSPIPLTKPPVDFASWYRDASPGPMHPCTTGSVQFDNDAVWNRSNPAFNLTPTTPYSCKTATGELTWDPVSSKLTIAGTIFFDGDVYASSKTAWYDGRATLYAAGTFTMGQQSRLCGVAACDTTWDATADLLAVVAGAPTGDSVSIQQFSTFQGAIYAVNDYREGNNSTTWGPIIANQVHMQNSTVNHYVPIGTLLPGMPATYEEVVTLTTESGSWG